MLIYVNVIVASLNGNNFGLGLPDPKLIVDGGDRANNCAEQIKINVRLLIIDE